MGKLKGTIAATLFLLLTGAGSAYAVDILNTPAKYKQRGVEWTLPEMRLSGEGKLRSYGVEYIGAIGCDVTVTAIRDRNNKVKVEKENNSIDIKAKSNTASVTLSNCTVTDNAGAVQALPAPITFNNGEVKVKVKGYDVGFNGEQIFEKVKIKSKYDKRRERRGKRHGKKRGTVLKLKLYAGTITSVTPPVVVPQAPPVGIPW